MENKVEFKYKWEPLVVVALRIIIGGLFIFSGFVKGVDLWGVGYKVDDYLVAFGWTWVMPYADMLSALLPLSEFLAGLWLLLGSFRKFTVIFLLVMMAFMLPLSGYIAFANPVEDCGCFGEAVVISNWATFVKNIFITAGLVYLIRRNKGVRCLFSPAAQWMTVLFPAVYLILIMLYGQRVQPVIDFRPYKIGCAVESSEDAGDNFLFRYSKDGKMQEFNLDELPDSSWTFVDRVAAAPEVQSENSRSIAFFDMGEEVSKNAGLDEGDVLLLLVGDIDDINVAYSFRINEFYKSVSESGFNMICLTGSSDDEIRQWKELSMADYPVYTMDESELKSVARGNPAIVWLRGGIIMYKSAFSAFNFEEVTTDASEPDDGGALNFLIFMTLMLIASLFFVLLINRSPFLIKLTKRLRQNQK